MKTCSRCKVDKPLDMFYKNKACKDGYDYLCKICNYASNKKHRSKKSGKKYYAELQVAYRQSEKYQEWLVSPNGIAVQRRKKYRRRTLEKHAGDISTETVVILDQIFGNECIYCGSTHDITYDHVIPLSRGGSSNITNIVKACRSCNSGKCNFILFSEWYPENLNVQKYELWKQIKS